MPIFLSNAIHGHTYGIEVFAEWKPLLWWKIKPGYSFLHMNLTESLGNSTVETLETAAPRHQFSLRSLMDLPMDLELDLWLRYVDDLPTFNIDSYCMIDARLGWKPTNNLELSIAAQNIFDSQHTEFKEDFMNFAKTEVERSFYLKVTWRFN